MTIAPPAPAGEETPSPRAEIGGADRGSGRIGSLVGGELARALAERLVDDALKKLDAAGVARPVVDWEAVWSAGDDAGNDEVALGRVTVAAAKVARQILDLLPDGPPRPFVARLLDLEPAGEAVTSQPRAVRAFTWMRNVGVIVVLFVGWQLWGTSIAEHHTQAGLARQFAAETHPTGPAASGSDGLAARVGSPPEAARRAAKSRGSARPRAGPAVPTTSPPEPALVAPGSLASPPQGQLVGRIQIPAIGLSQYIVEGTSEQDLSSGPGHYTGTPLPGEAGNIGLAGHRTTYGAPFDHLDELTAGDNVYLTSATGQQFRYVVEKPPFAVQPTDVSVLEDFGDDRVTLTTCTPKFSASQRLVVVAELASSRPASTSRSSVAHGVATTVASTGSGGSRLARGAPADGGKPAGSGPPAMHLARHASAPTARVAAPGRGVPVALTGSIDATWRLGSLPVVLVIALVLALLGLTNRRAVRLYGRLAAWLVLAPLWAMGIYLLFQALESLLPSNL